VCAAEPQTLKMRFFYNFWIDSKYNMDESMTTRVLPGIFQFGVE
jgi:hypothetical protein